jgi:hypothetical protein
MGPTAQRVGGFDALLSNTPTREFGDPLAAPLDPVADFRARAQMSGNPLMLEIASLLGEHLE